MSRKKFTKRQRSMLIHTLEYTVVPIPNDDFAQMPLDNLRMTEPIFWITDQGGGAADEGLGP